METFTFVVFGDIQEHNRATERIIDLAVSMKPDFCVILGDLVNDGNDLTLWRECIGLLEPLSAISEIAALPGNHDYEQIGVAENFSRFFRNPGELTYLSMIRSDCRFLLVDSILESTDSLEQGKLDQNSPQSSWLQNELTQAKIRSQGTFVFAHHPIFMPTDIYFSTSPTIRVDELTNPMSSGNLLPVLTHCGIAAFFAGHLHLYERSTFEEINFITSGATGYEFPNLEDGENRYSELRLEKNHLCRIQLVEHRVRFQAVDAWYNVMDEWDKPLA